MDVEKICLKCMKEKPNKIGRCAFCGFDNADYHAPQGALDAWTILGGRYLIGMAGEKQPYVFHYQAFDLKRQVWVSIVEYFQEEIMRRQPDGLAVAFSRDSSELFRVTRQRFADIGSVLVQGKTIPGYAPFLKIFKENHTWYLVQASEGGKLLSDDFFRRELRPGTIKKYSPRDACIAFFEKIDGKASPDLSITQLPDHAYAGMAGQASGGGQNSYYNQRDPYQGGSYQSGSYQGGSYQGGSYQGGSFQGGQGSYGGGQGYNGGSGYQGGTYRGGGQGYQGGGQGGLGSRPGAYGNDDRPPKKNTALIIILCITTIVMLAAAGILGYRLVKNKQNENESETEKVENSSETSVSDEPQILVIDPGDSQGNQDDGSNGNAAGNQDDGGNGNASGSSSSTQEPEQPSKETEVKTPESNARPRAEGEAINTFMVYLVGSNLETQGSLGSEKIHEMAQQGINTDDNNILIYTGGTAQWQNYDIPNDVNCVWKITDNPDELKRVSSTDTKTNTGDPQALSDFLNFCYDNYPAQHYTLVFWDHGGGPEYGFGTDELFDGDGLTLDELRTAMKQSPFGEDNKLDWVGFDACLMASLEIADVFDEYADYMLASEETTPGEGWNYSFLKALDEGVSGKEVCERAAKAYVDSIQAISDAQEYGLYNPLVTISCMDLRKTGQVIDALDEFSRTASKDMENGNYARIARRRGEIKQFGLVATGGRDWGYDLVDLKDLADVYSADYPQQAGKLGESIDQFIFYEASNTNRSSGVMIYFPFDNELDYDYNGRDQFQQFSCSDEYRSFINGFMQRMLDGTSRASWTMYNSGEEGNDAVLTLSQDQVSDLYSASYTVFLDARDGSYVPVLSDVAIYPDAEGKLQVSGDQELVYIKGYNDQTSDPASLVVPVRQIEDDADTEYYITESIRVQDGETFLGNVYQEVSVNFSEEGTDKNVVVQNVTAQEEYDIDVPWMPSEGRNEISLDEWDLMTYTLKKYEPSYSNAGLILPYTEWNENDSYRVGSVDLGDDINVEKLSIRSMQDRFACQIVLQDVYGGVHASPVMRLNGR